MMRRRMRSSPRAPERKSAVRNNRNRSGRFIKLLLCLILVSSALCYLPGVSGPFIFDDYTNLIDNTYIKITSLDADSLYNAAYSLDSGPLQRPVAMLSFAINHYFTRTFVHSTAYKATNLFIHALTALALFWMLRLILSRFQSIRGIDLKSRLLSISSVDLAAFSIALLWAVHPIQLTSVLYVVQRMNSLSALFSLLALAIYLKGRQKIAQNEHAGGWLFLGFPASATLAILSKENALLLPLFILLLELFLYSRERPWKLWKKLTDARKRGVLLLGGGFLIALSIGAISYATAGYGGRAFTLGERLLTESRVLFFYLSLILLPRINRFGHQHDDIVISTSLWDPWTTSWALLGHLMLIAVAVVLRKRAALVSLGIFWFYIGHLLESTIFALEIAHEHRNYLPSVGVFLSLAGIPLHFEGKPFRQKLLWLTPLLVSVFAVITLLRASQWSDNNSFYRYEAMHHPKSARIQVGFANVLQSQHRYDEAEAALRRASEISPDETGYLIQMQVLTARQKKPLDGELHSRILEQLGTKPITSTTFLSMQHITNCLQTWCRSLQVPLEEWARAVLAREQGVGDKSYYHYVLGLSLASQGKVDEAIQSLYASYTTDRVFLHPLFALASIYVQLQMPDNAAEVLKLIRAVNRDSPHPRDKEIQLVATDIEKLRRGEPVTVPLINLIK